MDFRAKGRKYFVFVPDRVQPITGPNLSGSSNSVICDGTLSVPIDQEFLVLLRGPSFVSLWKFYPFDFPVVYPLIREWDLYL